MTESKLRIQEMKCNNPIKCNFSTGGFANIVDAVDELHVGTQLCTQERNGPYARLGHHLEVLRHEAGPRIQLGAGPEAVSEFRPRPDGHELEHEAVAPGHRRPDLGLARTLQAQLRCSVQSIRVRRTQVRTVLISVQII